MATALKLRSDINKLKKALQTKGISDSVKSKLKNQLERAESELDTIKKTGKAPKRSSVKSTKTALTALQKLVNRKKYSVYKGAGVDLEKDAGQGALATGRRISKGLKANQNGDKGSNKGNVYYEYRPNHLDVKQPKKKQTYPKLAEGGEMSSKNYKVQYNVGKSKYVINYHNGEKKHKDGSPFYDVAIFKNMKDFMAYKKKLKSEGYKEMAKGGMMADGGRIANDKQKFGLKILKSLVGFNDGQTLNGVLELLGYSQYRFGKYATESQVNEVKNQLDILIKMGYVEESGIGYKITKEGSNFLNMFDYGSYGQGGYMADGGMMAKGGTTFGKFGSGRINKNAWVSANYIGDSKVTLGDLQSYLERNTSEKFDKDKIYTITRTLFQTGDYTIDDKKEWKESIIYRKRKIASGGHMADGGEIIDPEELYKKLSNAESKFNEDGGAEYRRVKEQISENRKRYFDRLDKSESKWSEDGGAEYKSQMKMRDKFMKGGYMAKGGMVEHGIKVGDLVTFDSISEDNTIEVKNKYDDKSYRVNLNEGTRVQMKSDGSYMAEGAIISKTHKLG
jgi:hypothetical protein